MRFKRCLKWQNIARRINNYHNKMASLFTLSVTKTWYNKHMQHLYNISSWYQTFTHISNVCLQMLRLCLHVRCRLLITSRSRRHLRLAADMVLQYRKPWRNVYFGTRGLTFSPYKINKIYQNVTGKRNKIAKSGGHLFDLSSLYFKLTSCFNKIDMVQMMI